MTTITEALAQLDTENDAHWTQDGAPALDALKTLVGSNVSRAAVTAEAPEFTRETARAAKVAPPAEEPDPAAPAEPAPEATDPAPEVPVRADGGEGVQPVENPGSHVQPTRADGSYDDQLDPSEFIAGAGLARADLLDPDHLTPPSPEVIRKAVEAGQIDLEEAANRRERLAADLVEMRDAHERLRKEIERTQLEHDAYVTALDGEKPVFANELQSYFAAQDATNAAAAERAGQLRALLGPNGASSAAPSALDAAYAQSAARPNL